MYIWQHLKATYVLEKHQEISQNTTTILKQHIHKRQHNKAGYECIPCRQYLSQSRTSSHSRSDETNVICKLPDLHHAYIKGLGLRILSLIAACV